MVQDKTMKQNDPELIDYVWIIWKRKWIIGIGTIVFMAAAMGATLLIKPVYEIDAIVQPGQFLVEDRGGNFTQVVVEPPQQTADKVRHRSYQALIAAQLAIDEDILPKIEAENPKNTQLIRLWVRSSDTKLAKDVLQKIIAIVREDLDRKLTVEIKNLDSSIKADEILKQRSLEEIEILNKKQKIGAQRMKDIQAEMGSVKGKIAELEKEQLSVLKKESRTEIEGMAMLLYSNEVQQSLQYVESLNEKLSREKLQEEDINSAIKEELSKIDQYSNNIENLEERKGRIEQTRIIKDPNPGRDPVFPRMRSNILLAFVAGILLFTFLAFLIEYVAKNKPEGDGEAL
jgi:capsular polysaccharide biosynthesis protein